MRLPLLAVLNLDEAIEIAMRVGVGYARKRPWLETADVVQEAVLAALIEAPKLVVPKYIKDSKPYFGHIIKLRLHDWQRHNKSLYNNSIRIDHVSLNNLENVDGYEDKGYWFIEELSTFEERQLTMRTRKPLPVTPRQRQVLQLIAHGHSAKTAAAHLHTSHETVRSQLQDARHRLDAKNTTHAVSIAWRKCLID